MDYAWTCRCCGKQHNTLPLDIAFKAPDYWLQIPEAERGQRGMCDTPASSAWKSSSSVVAWKFPSSVATIVVLSGRLGVGVEGKLHAHSRPLERR
jgi:hypothetical protein